MRRQEYRPRKMGTALANTISRLLEPENHVPYNNVIQPIIQTTAHAATITEYVDGDPMSTESLQVLKNTRALPTDKFDYSSGTTSELVHWALHKRPEYTRLHNSGCYQHNTWNASEPALNWASYLEASCYNLQPPADATNLMLALRLTTDVD